MKKKLIPLLVAGSALIAGCDKPASTPSANGATPATSAAPVAVVDKADAVAVVNGHYIAKSTLADLEKEVAARSQGQTFPKEKLIEELVQRQLLIQDALQKQLDKSPEVTLQLENAKNTLLTQADLQNFLKTNPVSDADLKKEYDSKVGGTNATEYKASHILVKTEDEAKKLITDLDKGAKFADLANKNSLDAKESQNGGELGWFAAGQMVEPFSDAVAKLEKGKYSKTPVKTQFGYHIILREDSRAQTPPPFDAVKEQLKPILERKKVQEMVETMRKQATVEILVPLVDEKPKADDKPVAGEQPKADDKAAVSEQAPVAEEKASAEKDKATEVEEAGTVKSPATDSTKEAEPKEVESEEGPKPTEPATAETPDHAKHHDVIPVKPEAKENKK
ncbi:MAG: peptidylprolyl isomerase [Methylococcales bacterium]|nr:peptidylprolyl isomerase [Methylococcales bacterium]